MSRTFELLQRAQSLLERHTSGVHDSEDKAGNTKAETVPVNGGNNHSCVGSIRATLFAELDPTEKAELLKMISGLFCLGQPNAPRVVLVADVDGSLAAHRLASSAGKLLSEQAHGNVCIVDAQLTHFPPESVDEMFEVFTERDWADTASGEIPIRSYCRQLSGKLFSLSAAAILSSGDGRDSMPAIVKHLRTEFTYSLIAAPPVRSSASDAILLGQLADGVLLVLQANTTRRDTARAVKQMFVAAKVPVLGAILTNRTFPIPEKIYERI